MNLPKLYPITDARLTNLSHAEQVERLRDGGARFIQLREKHLSPRDFYEAAEAALDVARERGVRLIVNDRADIALAAGADGVHLTARSLDPLVVRNISPRGFLIGISTHSLEEARAASASDADFAVFGPVFDTPSKEAYGAPLGLTALSEATHAVAPFPLLALGGITRARIPQVVAAGARGIAAIRLFGDESELDAVVKELRESCGEQDEND